MIETTGSGFEAIALIRDSVITAFLIRGGDDTGGEEIDRARIRRKEKRRNERL